MKVIPIKTYEVEPWILEKHYAKRMPNIMFSFGLYIDDSLVGVVTYGLPASPFLCVGVCGERHKDKVLELNRLCIDDGIRNGASFLVAQSMKMLPSPLIVVSYADTSMGHVGYIYQACNFYFTGTTKERTDMFAGEGKHSRHNNGNKDLRVHRSAKHRYVYFIGNKTEKKQLLNDLRYLVQPYPKGQSRKYDAGEQVKIQKMLFI